MVDSKSILKRVCSKHKRTITIVKNKNLSVEDCFSIMDHVLEKDKFSDGNENFYEVLSKSGLTATTNQSLFKIKFLQLADTMGVLDEDGGSNVLTTKDDDKHLIQMVGSCPQCHRSSSNTLNTTVQHMCREIPHSSGATTIIASCSFKREFDMESFHERVVSCIDLTLPIGNDKYFFYSLTTKPQQNMKSVGGKSMNTLQTE